jgi:hypothetical protein
MLASLVIWSEDDACCACCADFAPKIGTGLFCCQLQPDQSQDAVRMQFGTPGQGHCVLSPHFTGPQGVWHTGGVWSTSILGGSLE